MATNFAKVQSPYLNGIPDEEIVEVSIQEDEIEMDPELLEMLNRQNELNNEQIYNLISDQNDNRERSMENFSSQEIDEQVEADAKELEREYFEEWAQTHPDSESPAPAQNSSTTAGESNNPSKSANDPGPGNMDNKGDNAFAGKVMVSFSLLDRKAHALEIPGYTCKGSGKVVINIKVDKAGNVKSTSLNSSKSSGATECMIEKAQRYAKRSRFDYVETASALASGTITYTFKGQ